MPPERYAGHRIFVVTRKDYLYVEPFVKDEHTVFLKMIHPDPVGPTFMTCASDREGGERPPHPRAPGTCKHLQGWTPLT